MNARLDSKKMAHFYENLDKDTDGLLKGSGSLVRGKSRVGNA